MPERTGRNGGGWRRRLTWIAIIAAVLTSILVLLSPPDHDGVRTAAARARPTMLAHAQVTITSRGMRNVPRSFLGLSTEYRDVPVLERRMAPFERILALLHVRGDGPLVLRIGGGSADHTFWEARAARMPGWVFELTPAWLQRTATLVRRTGVRLILDLNLVTGSPLTAAQWAGAADQALPHGSLIGLEIGNEPDIYSRPYWRAIISAAGSDARVLPSALPVGTYTQDFASYAHMLADVAPGVPLVGPAVARPQLDANWIRGLIAAAHPELGIVSAHRYPYSACAKRGSRGYPTIARLLSQRASAGMAQSVKVAVLLAHRAGLPFRLTELNSVTCGGRPGVSDTFATALWAPDALFDLLRTGVDGVNVHVRTNAVNAAFTPTSHGLQAQPLLYGLLLFARTLGADARLLGSHVHAAIAPHLTAWAVQVHGDVLHLLLIDKSNRPVSVALHLPATDPAVVERLLAPSVRSSSGMTLDGQVLGDDGTWHGRPAAQTITPDAHGYQLTMPAESAALLRVQLGSGDL